MLFLVGLDSHNVLSRPAPMLTAIHSNLFRSKDFSISLPSEQRDPVNSRLSRSFLCRIRLHLGYTSIAYVVKRKANPEGRDLECADPGQQKEYRNLAADRRSRSQPKATTSHTRTLMSS